MYSVIKTKTNMKTFIMLKSIFLLDDGFPIFGNLFKFKGILEPPFLFMEKQTFSKKVIC